VKCAILAPHSAMSHKLVEDILARITETRLPIIHLPIDRHRTSKPGKKLSLPYHIDELSLALKAKPKDGRIEINLPNSNGGSRTYRARAGGIMLIESGFAGAEKLINGCDYSCVIEANDVSINRAMKKMFDFQFPGEDDLDIREVYPFLKNKIEEELDFYKKGLASFNLKKSNRPEWINKSDIVIDGNKIHKGSMTAKHNEY